LNKWQSNFANKVNFLLVYISEAHANDEWPLGKHIDIPAHKTISDRQQAAKMLLDRGCKIPILLDSMNNAFDYAFAVWPERYYIVKSGKMEHVFYPQSEFGFDHAEMLKKLNECCQD